MDWEALVRELQEQRQGQDMLQVGTKGLRWPRHGMAWHGIAWHLNAWPGSGMARAWCGSAQKAAAWHAMACHHDQISAWHAMA